MERVWLGLEGLGKNKVISIKLEARYALFFKKLKGGSRLKIHIFTWEKLGLEVSSMVILTGLSSSGLDSQSLSSSLAKKMGLFRL